MIYILGSAYVYFLQISAFILRRLFSYDFYCGKIIKTNLFLFLVFIKKNINTFDEIIFLF